MAKTIVHTLDLNFQGQPLAIASYMLEHSGGVVLVESGPGSTLEGLRAALRGYGYTLQDITHVLLTHIHLDHAGAAGYLARQGAQIFVHPVGAPHLLDPGKLIASASRIYGDLMQTLWGEILPVPAEKLTVLNDNDELEVGALVASMSLPAVLPLPPPVLPPVPVPVPLLVHPPASTNAAAVINVFHVIERAPSRRGPSLQRSFPRRGRAAPRTCPRRDGARVPPAVGRARQRAARPA